MCRADRAQEASRFVLRSPLCPTQPVVQKALADKAKGVGGPAVTRMEPAEKCSVWNYQVRPGVVRVSGVCGTGMDTGYEMARNREGQVLCVELRRGGGCVHVGLCSQRAGRGEATASGPRLAFGPRLALLRAKWVRWSVRMS